MNDCTGRGDGLPRNSRLGVAVMRPTLTESPFSQRWSVEVHLLLLLLGCAGRVDSPEAPSREDSGNSGDSAEDSSRPDSEDSSSDTGFVGARETTHYNQEDASLVLTRPESNIFDAALFTPDLNQSGAEDILIWTKQGTALSSDQVLIVEASLIGRVDPWRAGVTLTVSDESTELRAPSVGEFNGDGVPDLLAPSAERAEGVMIMLGPFTENGPILADIRIREGSGENVDFDAAVSDTDGDGIDDVVVRVNQTQGTYVSGVYLLPGPLTGDSAPSDASDRVISGESLRGAGLAVPEDVDGDGYDDFLLGFLPDRSASGGAWFIRGPVVGTRYADESDSILLGAEPDEIADDAGRAVSLPGDMDGDGRGEVVVSGPWGGTADVEGGVVWVVPGVPSGVLSLETAAARLYGATACAQAGVALGGSGDADGDGLADLLVGAPGFLDDAGYCPRDGGSTWLLRGPASGPFWLDGSDVSFTAGTEPGFGAFVDFSETTGRVLAGFAGEAIFVFDSQGR